ncbi:MAG: hydrogenase iron-sulfur subunit [Candidatus Eisenbacteria bacterium]|nr:hydrogenase iron-sulfur subunit [Candidatus Eisenbacteria bacterium]
MAESFDPKILYVMCGWCGTGGAETASAYGMYYPENVRIFRVNCTGALSTVHMLRPLLEGADGLVISGCHPGDCHYDDGNFMARRKVALVKTILDSLGLDSDRLWFRYVAHGEARRFVDTAAEFTDHIKSKGPNPLATRSDT